MPAIHPTTEPTIRNLRAAEARVRWTGSAPHSCTEVTLAEQVALHTAVEKILAEGSTAAGVVTRRRILSLSRPVQEGIGAGDRSDGTAMSLATWSVRRSEKRWSQTG